ncbi:MAG: radical SAM protein, partial [Opitutales bacterium]|nr:radical SAM protein [Opitutales bacterium]
MSDTRGRKIKIKEIKVRSYISPSKLPTVDFVINPYVGCPHKCIYCYASFMKRFVAGHNSEDWGDFIDVKLCDEPINIKNSSTTLLGSVTDPYNPFEAKYLITKDILQQLVAQSPCNTKYDILTKSSLVLRDMDLLKKIKNIRVGISMNTLDDGFRKQIEPYAVSVESRIETLKCLSENGINTYLFMSPIFPGITDFRKIVKKVLPFIKIAYFENLNLRGSYRA